MTDYIIVSILSAMGGFGFGFGFGFTVVTTNESTRDPLEDGNVLLGDWATGLKAPDAEKNDPHAHVYQLVKVVEGKHVPYVPPLLIPACDSPILTANRITQETQIFHTYELFK